MQKYDERPGKPLPAPVASLNVHLGGLNLNTHTVGFNWTVFGVPEHFIQSLTGGRLNWLTAERVFHLNEFDLLRERWRRLERRLRLALAVLLDAVEQHD